MVYTMSRLEHALLVFRESESYRARRDLKATNLEALLTQPRQHHTRGRAAKPIWKQPELWEKSDESDDDEYNPSKEKKKKKGAEAKVKKVKKGKETCGGGVKDACGTTGNGKEKQKKKRTTWLRGRIEGKELSVTLKLSSENGKALLKDMAEKYGAWDVDADNDLDETTEQTAAEKRVAKSDRTFAMTGLRLNATQTPMQLLEQKRRIEAKYGDEMVPDESEWVCDGVHSLRNRVVAAMPKPKTQLCGPCRREKRSCTMKAGLSGSCNYCAKLDRKCWVLEKAGDVKKSDGDEGKEKKPGNAFSEGHLALDRLEKEPPQNSRPPIMQGSGSSENDAIIIIDSPPPMLTPTSIPRPQAYAEEQASAKCIGRTKIITTYWAHPINFMHRNFASAGQLPTPCHFCVDFRYGIIGCGNAKVEVIQYANSLEYEETGNGNVARGCEPTRMCIICGLNRLHISNCVHKMGLLTNPDPRKLNYQSWMTQLSMTGADRNKKLSHPCCSLCRSPATFVCRGGTNEVIIKGCFPDGTKSNRKCMLYLCDGCEGAVKKFGWRRWKLEADILGKGLAARADIEFLFWGSDLHKAWGCSVRHTN